MKKLLFILFVRSPFQDSYPKPRLGGVPRSAINCHKEPLAVHAFVVQNGPAMSSVIRRAIAVDRAEIGRISRLPFTDSCRESVLSPAILGPNRVSVNGPELIWATNPTTGPQGLMVGGDFSDSYRLF